MGNGLLQVSAQSWLACMLALSLIVPAVPAAPEPPPPPPPPPMVRTVTWQTQNATGAPVLYRRMYALDNGDSVCMGRLETQKKGDAVTEVERLSTDSPDGTIRYYDEKAEKWVHTPVRPGKFYAGMIQISFAQEDFFFYLPKTYRRLANSSVEYLPRQDGYLDLKKTGTGWDLTLYARAPGAGCNADYVCVRSQEALLDWSKKNTGELWKNYTMSGDSGKWCFDGYFWPATTLYVPTGNNVYFRNIASYLVKSFVYAGDVHRVAADLGRCMLDTLTLYQTADGCWITPSKSTWLSGDYGVGAGFYDTRFNTELVQIMIYSDARYGGDAAKTSMNRYADFYQKFALAHHTTTDSGGWLVEDYWSPAGSRKTHTSLNHLVAECDLLYRLSKTLNRPELALTADKLLLGIRDTGKRWIRPNGDLHYAIYPNGSYWERDYEYLTYNDLFTLRALRKQQGRAEEPILTQLMAAKKGWMDRNGIIGYLK